jgi:hypothetical protein
MLENFLSALSESGAVKYVKRIILVTGAKQYGVHLGPARNPMMETDPWLRDPSWPPNFYYRQQDALKDFCEANPGVEWVVTYPNDVIGFAKGNYMNLAAGLGLYAVVTRELQEMEGKEIQKDKFLPFPGSEAFYSKFDSFTTSSLHARFCVWAATEPRAANQAFNVVNGDVQSWQSLWPSLARRFGMTVPNDQFSSLLGEFATETTLYDPPPLSLVAVEMGLASKIQPGRLSQRINLAKWSQQDKVKEAWNRLAQREGLQVDAFEKATWAFIDFVLGRDYDLVISMSKARECGWTG